MKKIIILFVLPFFLFFIIIAGTGDAIASSDRPTTDIDDVSGDENYDDYVPNGDSEIGNAIVTSALSELGSQYVWGASGPNTFDCSGLVWWACHENGVILHVQLQLFCQLWEQQSARMNFSLVILLHLRLIQVMFHMLESILVMAKWFMLLIKEQW